jgi:serine/threonine protein kinase
MRGILTLQHRDLPPRAYVLNVGFSYVIGRGREATIRIDDERISRKHVIVTLDERGFHVEELGSRNGALLDNHPLAPHAKVNLGMRGGMLEMGDAKLRIELEGDEQDARAKRIDSAFEDLAAEYEVMGEVGQGASGRVFVARQKFMDRQVAIKCLKPQYAPGSRERERFLKEGKLAARVKSPYVVEVYDVRVVGEKAYIVMELVQGPSAKERLAQGPIALPDVLQIGEDVARALSAASDATIVHRDVKPGNILLSPEGLAKLTDFGIAKDLDESTIQQLTAAGDGLGTLAYVSPEQATDARTVDHRSDLYSLGATLYHMLAARPPFIPSNARVLLDILDKPAPPLVAYRPDAPEDVAHLVDSLLKKNPRERPQNAHEVARRLKECRLRHGFGARSAGRDGTLGSTGARPALGTNTSGDDIRMTKDS